MEHPHAETLMAWTYGELDEPAGRAVEAHLRSCDLCGKRVEQWRSVRSQLQRWKIADAPRPRVALPAAVRWAAAASVLLGVGFAAAKLTGPRVSPEQIRAEVAQQMRQEIHQTLAAETARFASEQTSRQTAFQQAVLDAVSQLELRQVSDHASLRRDVETVALRTQEQFERLADSDRAEPAMNQ